MIRNTAEDYLIVTSCDTGSVDALAALAESIESWCSEARLVVLATDASSKWIDKARVVTVSEIDDTPFLSAKVLCQADQLALARPRLLARLLDDVPTCLWVGPGMLLQGDPEELLARATHFGVAFAQRVSVWPAHSTTGSLGPLDAGQRSLEPRVMAVSRKADGFLADWSGVTGDAVLDVDQRSVSLLSDMFLMNSIGRPDVSIEGESTLIHWTDLAAIGSGRAEGPVCPVVVCDDLFAVARQEGINDDDEVDWNMLVHKVHDSRPIDHLATLIRDAQGAAEEVPAETYFDVLSAEIRRASDPYGRRWSATDDSAYRTWLFDRNVNGLTRVAHAMSFLDSDLLTRFPKARFDASKLEDWWRDNGLDRYGFDAFDPSMQPTVIERPTEAASGLVNALRWRWSEAQKLLPRANQRAIDRYLRQIVGPDPSHKRGVAAPSAVEVTRVPPLWGASPREINLLGCFRAESGLGQAARASLHALRHLGREFSSIDTSEKYPSRNSVDVGLSSESYGQLGDVNLIHSNADEMLTLAGGAFKHRFAGRFNAAMWFWETADLPPRGRQALQIVDELWVASEYLRDVFGQYAAVPVHVIGLAVDLPVTRTSHREDFGWSDDEIVFLFVYDALSSYGRKNPRKALDAFVKAFGPRFEDVRFVLKVSNLNKFPASQREILGLAERYPAITVIDEYLERDQVMDLMASSDVYVSLHAAEGFGLTLLEAMALGTPTICTGYSGNMDFTTDENSWLVDYTMMATDAQTGPYPPGSVWASPNVDAVVEIMRSIRDDPAQIRVKADRADVDARKAASPETYAERLDEQLRRVL